MHWIAAAMLAVVLQVSVAWAQAPTALTSPNAQDKNTYARFSHTAVFSSAVVSLTFSREGLAAPAPRARLRVTGPDGLVQLGDWTDATGVGNKIGWTFSTTLPDGYYLVRAEAEDGGMPPYEYAMLVAEQGPPLGASRIPVPATRYSRDWKDVNGPVYPSAWATWPGIVAPITSVPLQLPAGLQPWNTPKSMADLWVYPIGVRGRYLPRVLCHQGSMTEECYPAAGDMQLYFWSRIAGCGEPILPGPRGVSLLGHIVQAIAHPQGDGFYFLSINGALGKISRDGHVEHFRSFCSPPPGNLLPDYFEFQGSATADVQVSNEWFDSKLAYVGTGIDPGGDRTWFRPWGMTAIPMPAPCDKGFHKFAVADTYNHVIRIVNHWFAHGPNHPECAGPGLATTDAVLTGTFGTPTSPLLDHVWSVQVDPQDPDLLWLVARGSHTSKRGAIGSYRISTQAMTVDILSALPFSDEGVLKASFGKDVAATRAAVLRDGGQGTATLTLPEGADWSSDGLLIFVEGSGVNGSGTFVVRAFDRVEKTVTTVANLTRFANGRECVLHIDREGVVGPKDDILVGCWGQDTDHRLRRTGVKTWIVAPENNGRVVKPAMKPVECNTGPLDKCEWVNTYPWVFAPGTAALPCMFNASTAQFDARLICGRLPEQLAPDAVKHAAGVTSWRSPHGATPPLALLCGTHGWGQLGDATCPQWPSLNLMNDADLATWLMQKGGLSVEEAANVAYVIRWNARY